MNQVVDGGLDSQYFGGQVNAEFATFQHRDVAAEWVALIESTALAGAVDAAIAGEIGGAVRDAITNAIAAHGRPAAGRGPVSRLPVQPRDQDGPPDLRGQD